MSWCVCSRDESVQLACLKLVHSLLRQLHTDDIIALLPTLAAFVDSRSVACRVAAYDVFMWLHDNFSSAVAGSVTAVYWLLSVHWLIV